MIKYFHELTEQEYKELVDKKTTWAELERNYPQPPWCDYSEATRGIMGCWALVTFKVTGEDFCKNCDLYNKNWKKK